jgi:TRAP-type C4-dicarboxylate transport system permease small subunit
MALLTRLIHHLAKILYWISGAAIIAMMLLTCMDVILRLCVTLFRKYQFAFLANLQPIAGTYELVCFFSAIAVAFAMANTALQKGHVSVSLFTRLFPPRLQALTGILTTLFGLTFFTLLSWRSIQYAGHIHSIGEVSPTLQLPFYPFIHGVGFASAAVCLVLLLELIEHLKGL